MKVKMMLFSGVLAASLGVSGVAWGGEKEPAAGDKAQEVLGALFEEGGLVDGLLSEDGPLADLFGEDSSLKDLLPSEEELDELLGKAEEKLNEVGGEVEAVVDEVLSQVRDEDGNFDSGKVEELVSSILGMISGEESDDVDFDAIDALIAQSQMRLDAIESYILEANMEFMDPGDVQLVTLMSVWDTFLDGEEDVRQLMIWSQNNYTLEGTELHLLSSSSETSLFTLHGEEDGSYTVTDMEHAEEGEGNLTSIEAMCEEIGTDTERYYDAMEYVPIAVLDDMIEYLEEHEELEGIEYQGEIRSLDELKAIKDDLVKEIYGGVDTESMESLAEEMLSESFIEEAEA